MNKWNILTEGQEFIPEEEICTQWMWVLFRGPGWNRAAIATSGYSFKGKIDRFVLATANEYYEDVRVKDVKAWMHIVQPEGPPESPWYEDEDSDD